MKKTFSVFKDNLKLDQMDANHRHHLIREFKSNVQAEEATDSDESIIQLWLKNNRDDPWPFIITSLLIPKLLSILLTN